LAVVGSANAESLGMAPGNSPSAVIDTMRARTATACGVRGANARSQFGALFLAQLDRRIVTQVHLASPLVTVPGEPSGH
jgi:hypothetical protein